eukprot:2960492-Alexandrium_andersonii.AAC.1
MLANVFRPGKHFGRLYALDTFGGLGITRFKHVFGVCKRFRGLGERCLGFGERPWRTLVQASANAL